MLLIDIKDKELAQEEVEILSHPLISGLILFSRNFYDKQQIQGLVKDIRQRVKKPLLITVDQEGGEYNASVKALQNCLQCSLLAC